MFLAEHGDKDAAATLDYVFLRGTASSVFDGATVRDLCLRAAYSGAGYASYVCSWRCFQERDYTGAIQWMTKSINMGFVPAIGDSAQMYVRGAGLAQKRPDVARNNLLLAIRRGHLPSLVMLTRFGLRGIFGFHWFIASVVGYPIAVLMMLVFARIFPFDKFVFAHAFENSRPLFRGAADS